jgi:fluoroacetyl-CoA thioesterase
VAVKHLAPTLMGMTVEIAVHVVAVDGRKVSFEATVKDELDQVGAGTHTRFVVEKAKTFERLKAKAARLAAQSGQAQ